MSSETDYTLVLYFHDQSPSFVNGFECGGIWERLKAEPDELHETVHLVNDEQLHAMALRTGYALTIEPCDDGCWAFATFTRKAVQ